MKRLHVTLVTLGLFCPATAAADPGYGTVRGFVVMTFATSLVIALPVWAVSVAILVGVRLLIGLKIGRLVRLSAILAFAMLPLAFFASGISTSPGPSVAVFVLVVIVPQLLIVCWGVLFGPRKTD